MAGSPETESVLDDLVAGIDGAPIAGLPANLSGLTYSAPTGSLFAVINRPPAVAEISTEGVLLRLMPLAGAGDPEGITHVQGDTFLVADEHDQSVHLVRIGPDTRELNVGDTPVLRLDFGSSGNAGFEGASWDSRTGRLYLVQERLPLRILAVDGLLRDGARSAPSVRVEERRLPWLHRLALLDLSSVSLHEPSGHLLLLSDASGVIVEYDEAARLVGRLDLDGGRHGLAGSVPQAEGLAVDGRGRVFIVSEPNLFYRLDRRRGGSRIRRLLAGGMTLQGNVPSPPRESGRRFGSDHGPGSPGCSRPDAVPSSRGALAT